MKGPWTTPTGAVSRPGWSVLAVLATAVGFDLVADEPGSHVLAVALAATAVGGVRLLLRGRLRGVFALVNLAVLAQPAAHAVATLTHAGGLGPARGLPVHVSTLALQVAITVLVVLVAGSEPLLCFVAALPLARLLAGPVPADAARLVGRADGLRRSPLDVRLARCLPRRGPPATAATTA